MSKTLSDKTSSLSIEAMKPELVSAIENMLQVLNMNQVPSPDSCTALKALFQHYMDALARRLEAETVQECDIQIEFTDVPGEDVKSNDIIADLLQDPDVVEALCMLGLRKIAKTEELPLSEDQNAVLMSKGYGASLKIISDNENTFYFALTSKGWLCFQRSFIVQQLRKRLGYTAILLPEWLAVPQLRWNSIAYKRAIALRDYYISTARARDFLVFSFPENTQLLFGCSADKGSELEYTCAVIGHNTFTHDEQKTLLKVIGAKDVAKVTLICTNEMDGRHVLANLKLSFALKGKVDLIMMEEKYE